MNWAYKEVGLVWNVSRKWVSTPIIPFLEKASIMQKITCCQPLKLVSFSVLLWQNTFFQVLCEWTSPVFTDEHRVTFLSICCNLVGLTLGLDLICVFTHTWPIETCPLKSAVKIGLSAGSASLIMHFLQLSLGLLLPYAFGQYPTWHPVV